MVCYGLTRGRDWQQETYETKSRHARKRANALRKLGFKVSVSSLGPQVTQVGLVKMTLVTIQHNGDELPPNPEEIQKL